MNRRFGLVFGRLAILKINWAVYRVVYYFRGEFFYDFMGKKIFTINCVLLYWRHFLARFLYNDFQNDYQVHSSIAILHQIGGLNGRLTVQTWVLLSAFACSSLDIVDMAGKTKIMDPKFGSLQRHLLELSWPIFRDYGLVNIFLGIKFFCL